MASSLTRSFQRSRPLLQVAQLSRNSKAVLKTFSEAQVAVAEECFEDPRISTYQPSAAPVINFDDPETVFSSKPTGSLLQSYAILKACRVQSLVHNAEALLGASKTLLGQTATAKLVEHTFFKQFCAGTNAETIQPTLARLRQSGIQPILNYAAEDDIEEPLTAEESTNFSLSREAALDRQAGIFMRSIVDCDTSLPSRGFVGIKLTGLTQPMLLERMSSILAEAGGTLDRGHSSTVLRKLMAAHLSPAEFHAFDNLQARVWRLASAVHEKGNMRILIDAEQTYMQPAIDAVTISLQQLLNREAAVVMNTYQCYLKDSAIRIEADLARARAEGWTWGAKLVRGAYMHLERARAAEIGSHSPIHDSSQDTHQNYNSCVEHVMGYVAGRQAELMVASHNQASVEAALQNMQHLGMPPHSPASGLYFGQLLGMADHLSFPLGAHGYNIYKICAYGSVSETIAFLLRRALENSDLLGGCAKEVELIKAELIRRTTGNGRSEPHPIFQHA